jgi:NTP pyrophosphatase (non-canonical NTP hydrolase)
MKKIIEDNYDSIVKRGLITPDTTKQDFINKLWEECDEFDDVYTDKGMIDAEELADIILVCLNIAKHYKIDIEKEMRGKIAVNFNRAANGR